MAESGSAVWFPECVSSEVAFDVACTRRTVRPFSAQLRKKPSLTWFVEDESAQTDEIAGSVPAVEAIVVEAPPESAALSASGATVKE